MNLKTSRLKSTFSMVQRVIGAWTEDGSFRLSAALAYYTVFSLGPLLMVSTGVAGLVYGRDAVHGALVGQLSTLMGMPAAEAINAFLADSANVEKSRLTTLVGVVVLFFGAAGVFLELKSALNLIWRVPPDKTTSLPKLVVTQLLSVAMVLSAGFLLLVSLVISAVLAAVSKYIEAVSGIPSSVFGLADVAITLLFVSTVFAMIFKFLPDAHVQWRAAWKVRWLPPYFSRSVSP